MNDECWPTGSSLVEDGRGRPIAPFIFVMVVNMLAMKMTQATSSVCHMVFTLLPIILFLIGVQVECFAPGLPMVSHNACHTNEHRSTIATYTSKRPTRGLIRTSIHNKNIHEVVTRACGTERVSEGWNRLAIDRRNAMRNVWIATTTATIGTTIPVLAVHAEESTTTTTKSKNVFVAGATGQTGRRVLERLAMQDGILVKGGVRNVEKATSSLTESSTVVRGAMIQNVNAVNNAASVVLQHLDVVQDSVDDMANALKGSDALIIAVGFVPGNPLKMNQEAHKVDNVGTCRLIDAAKQSGTIQKIVLVSSILTNGRNWGQEKSPGFVITNAFGNVLDEKIIAENYLRSSGLDYTIVRPGGLKAKPPSGTLMIAKEDTLNAGEISRDLVADVCVAALTDRNASNRVLEIVEDEGVPFQSFNGLNM